MESIDKLRREQARVLRAAREAAGFKSQASAIRASPIHEKWKASTVSAHQRGSRPIDREDAERYARFYRGYGARITGQEILYPESSQIIVEAKLAALAVEVKKLAEAAHEQRLARLPRPIPPSSIPQAGPRGPKSSK